MLGRPLRHRFEQQKRKALPGMLFRLRYPVIAEDDSALARVDRAEIRAVDARDHPPD